MMNHHRPPFSLTFCASFSLQNQNPLSMFHSALSEIMDRDRDFNFNFPFSGDSSSAPAPPWNYETDHISLYSDGNLHSLVPFPSDFSFNPHISDPNILLSKIPKLEPPFSPSYAHRFAGNLPALHSFESPTCFDSYFTKLEQPLSPSYPHHFPPNLPALQSFDSYFTKLEQPISPSYPHHFPSNLPALQSIESPTNFGSYLTNLTSGGSNNHQTLQPVAVQDVTYQNTSPPSSRGSKRKRSQRIGEKYRSLQKLIPLDKKMDTTSMLGEAYKYVKFLQAQVKALENMPVESGFKSENGALGSVFGEIGELSRKQLLQVVLNSPEFQIMLCSEGRCVFSIEQLVMLKKLISW